MSIDSSQLWQPSWILPSWIFFPSSYSQPPLSNPWQKSLVRKWYMSRPFYISRPLFCIYCWQINRWQTLCLHYQKFFPQGPNTQEEAKGEHLLTVLIYKERDIKSSPTLTEGALKEQRNKTTLKPVDVCFYNFYFIVSIMHDNRPHGFLGRNPAVWFNFWEVGRGSNGIVYTGAILSKRNFATNFF